MGSGWIDEWIGGWMGEWEDGWVDFMSSASIQGTVTYELVSRVKYQIIDGFFSGAFSMSSPKGHKDHIHHPQCDPH